jgi:hypothetical protein
MVYGVSHIVSGISGRHGHTVMDNFHSMITELDNLEKVDFTINPAASSYIPGSTATGSHARIAGPPLWS